VTVIATGFSKPPAAEPRAQETAEKARTGDVMSLEEWVKITSGKPSRGGGELFQNDDMGIPAVLRYRQAGK